MTNKNSTKFHNSKAYFIGGGIASLAGAAFLVRDANFPGENIHIIEQKNVNGGALDASGNGSDGFLSRGGRMFEKHYVCTFDLFSSIPSIDNASISAKDDVFEFNKKVVSDAKCRLLENMKKVDDSSYGLSWIHKFEMLRLILHFHPLTDVKIKDWFSKSFFDTVFWLLWTTSFSFQPWDNVDELRRYFLRFIHLLPGFNHFKKILRTRYNQYDAMILPLENWLKDHNVQFDMTTKVVDVKFNINNGIKKPEFITVVQNSTERKINLNPNDYLFITLGSMVANSTRGSMKKSVPATPTPLPGSWDLWSKISKSNSEFGNPEVFMNRRSENEWISFTVTQTTSALFDFMEKFTKNKTGTGGLVTFKDSNWLMSIVMFHQPFYKDQPEGTYVFWGYGLFPEEEGKYVKKKMFECTGKEILQEALSYLPIDNKQEIIDQSNCIPTLMPYITSQFQTRNQKDRPKVIPKNTENIGLLGQYVDIDEDVVFTVEYSIRSAMMAVYDLLKIDKKVPSVYKGYLDPIVLWNAFLALNR